MKRLSVIRFYRRARLVTISLFTLHFSLFTVFAQQPRMLVLGDSHMVGHFGDRLHIRLHELNRYEILSVAIGGSGSANYLYPLYDFCCGYMVRQAKPGDPLDKKGKFPWLAGSYHISNDKILENYYCRLDSVLSKFNPNLIVIELGSNIVNAHQSLLSLIHQYVPQAPVYWVGPYARALGPYRVREIQKVCFPLVNRCMLVRCDDILGSDSLISYHFTGDKANLWADTVAARVTHLIQLQQRHAWLMNVSYKYALLSARLISPFMPLFYSKIVHFAPGEGWLANALLK